LRWKTWGVVVILLAVAVASLTLLLSYVRADTIAGGLPTIITASLAVYGAALGTYNLILKRRQNIVNLKVTVNLGFMAIGRSVANTHISLEAANRG
jgi:hypothetical protein